ncbi:GWxTD domain-containing protein [candidate division WOR-3 bacterium]|nr:GWxTD domain-containing protein [candidate division WOR-3 bacterium]
MRNKGLKIGFVLLVLLFICCAVVNIFATRYYRLLEKERKIFLGLQSVDSLAAVEYLNLESPTERAKYYENYWYEKKESQRQEFEERIEYAYRQFGRYAPLSDDRIPIYVIYGPPSIREEITPQKKLAIKTKEKVKPAEIWTYKRHGIIFDFIRSARAYELIAQSEFGDKVGIPYLKEVAPDTFFEIEPTALLKFSIACGRFRQKKNLTRLEVYITLEIEDTTGLLISRNIQIFDKEDNLIREKKCILMPREDEQGIYFDEVNFWLEPEEYRLEIELADIKNRKVGKKTLGVNLLDYYNDAKEISDLIPAKLIDGSFTDEKFNKPVGRVIPLTQSVLPVHKVFYFYAEVYNLETKNSMHRIRTTYEVYNKGKMRKEIVDVMTKDYFEAGDVAYIAVEYHPMDLMPGHYIIVLRIEDLLSGKERTAVSEFELKMME